MDTAARLLKSLLPEDEDDVSGQYVHKEDGQADVEQDDHADHDGVGTLEETSVTRYGEDHR